MTIKKIKALSSGRPKHFITTTSTKSSRQTRHVIRTHHHLLKAQAKAKAANDDAAAQQIQAQLDAIGGLKNYQSASVTGQSSSRGGDSSKTLMTWLAPLVAKSEPKVMRLRMLEVGALSTSNVCSKSGIFDVTRIDLHAQTTAIMQQDFMLRPMPMDESGRYDIVSLSLVLNYVPDALGRGEMLRRVSHFLLPKQIDHASLQRSLNLENMSVVELEQHYFPCLFLVLPAPCVNNSRYFNKTRLISIMTGLGYVMINQKVSAKLAYYLFRWNGVNSSSPHPKTEVNPGRSRNNFAVIME